MKRYPAKIFFCYSHKDEQLRDELEKHLKMIERQGLIINWHDRRILPGKNWSKTIDINLESSDIVLPLLSPDFLASDYCVEVEMKRAMELHRVNQLQIVPIILRICDWQNSEFAKFQGLPTDMEPVKSSKWFSEDEAFFNIVHGLKEVIAELFDETETDFIDEEAINNIQILDQLNDQIFNEKELRNAVLVLRAANHKIRERLCRFIQAKQEATLSDIVLNFKFDQSVVSQHLAILRRAKIVNTRRNGKFIHYTLNGHQIELINKTVSHLLIE